jgi:hypothetical protein
MQVGDIAIIGDYNKRIMECAVVGQSYFFVRCIASKNKNSVGQREAWKAHIFLACDGAADVTAVPVPKNDLPLYTHFKFKSPRFFEILESLC